MTNREKLRLLRRLLDKSATVKVEDRSDPAFVNWKNLVERTLARVFGKNSTEFEHFGRLGFFANVAMVLGRDYSYEHLQAFRSDFKVLIDSIHQYIEEIEEESDEATVAESLRSEAPKTVAKVFISHASEDRVVAEEIVDLLEVIGLQASQIFCSSFEGYGVGLGENFLNSLRGELQGNVLVVFILSGNFYRSPYCLCEMGASWVLSRHHIPILLPPYDYSDVRGVIPLTQGMKVNEPLKLNQFKEKIEALFELSSSLNASAWERKRNRTVDRINQLLNGADTTSSLEA